MNDAATPLPDDRRADATAGSHPRDTGSSNKESTPTNIAGIAAIEVETAALRQARTRQAGRFLRGPISLRDIAAAARLSGKALAVFLAVHHRTAITRNAAVTLPKRLLTELGITKDAKARALHALETAGLIRVERRAGRAPIIVLNQRN